MAEEKKNASEKVITAEFKIYMHCNGCERTVAKTISKIKGVEKFMTDMTKHIVVLIGKFDPEKVMKKLKKKTGKTVEILSTKEYAKDPEVKEEVASPPVEEEKPTHTLNILIHDYSGFNFEYRMFSDENANACSIM